MGLLRQSIWMLYLNRSSQLHERSLCLTIERQNSILEFEQRVFWSQFMNSYDPTNNVSWQLGHRGRVAVFIDGNNLFHAARFHNIDIDYNKLLRVLLGDGRLLRAFFYTGVDVGAERQQGFLLWMRRNGFRVIQKELKTFYDGTRKANLDVEIAVDMLSLAGRYDTAVLVSGDEDFVYAVNAVAYKGCRVEIAGFRSNTAPKLIDVADCFIDLGEIADKVRKDFVPKYEDRDIHYSKTAIFTTRSNRRRRRRSFRLR